MLSSRVATAGVPSVSNVPRGCLGDMLCSATAPHRPLTTPQHDPGPPCGYALGPNLALTLQAMWRASRARAAAAAGAGGTAGDPGGQQRPGDDELADVEEDDTLLSSDGATLAADSC